MQPHGRGFSHLPEKGSRDVMGLSEDEWLRGKACALYGAVIALSYYRGGRNEPLCEQCRLTLSRLDLML